MVRNRNRPPRADGAFLEPDQKRLQGHARSRAIVSNLAAKGLTVAEIVEVTGYTVVAVEHHLEVARAARPINGRDAP